MISYLAGGTFLLALALVFEYFLVYSVVKYPKTAATVSIVLWVPTVVYYAMLMYNHYIVLEV